MKTDFLVIGSGIAGLNFALLAAEHGRVVLVTKKEIMESNTNQAQGGIAAVMSTHDSKEAHIADTLRTGCGLCDERAVRVLASRAPTEIKRLIAFGVGFNREHGSLALSREGGHSERRIVFAGDCTGREIERALVFNVRRTKAITVFADHFVLMEFVLKATIRSRLRRLRLAWWRPTRGVPDLSRKPGAVPPSYLVKA